MVYARTYHLLLVQFFFLSFSLVMVPAKQVSKDDAAPVSKDAAPVAAVQHISEQEFIHKFIPLFTSKKEDEAIRLAQQALESKIDLATLKNPASTHQAVYYDLLFSALLKKMYRLAKFLVDHGVGIEQKRIWSTMSCEPATALEHALFAYVFQQEYDILPVIQALLEKGMSAKDARYNGMLLKEAISDRYTKAESDRNNVQLMKLIPVRKLLDPAFVVKKEYEKIELSPVQKLIIAIRAHNVAEIRSLIKQGGFEINAPAYGDNYAPLQWLHVSNSPAEIIQEVLKAPGITQRSLDEAAHLAIENENLTYVRLLLEHGASLYALDVGVHTKNKQALQGSIEAANASSVLDIFNTYIHNLASDKEAIARVVDLVGDVKIKIRLKGEDQIMTFKQAWSDAAQEKSHKAYVLESALASIRDHRVPQDRARQLRSAVEVLLYTGDFIEVVQQEILEKIKQLLAQ